MTPTTDITELFDQIVHNSEQSHNVFITCYLLNVTDLSLIAFGVLTDYHAYLQRLTDLRTRMNDYV